MARIQLAATTKQPEMVIKTRGNFARGEYANPSGRQFDGKRDAADPTNDCLHLAEDFFVQHKVCVG